MNNLFLPFTNKYKLSKTLKFELKPVGETLENIQSKGLLTNDIVLADNYKKVKKIIDEYHKYFINTALVDLELLDLMEYEQIYNISNKTTDDKKRLFGIQKNLRSQIANALTKNPKSHVKSMFANLFKKELIQNDLYNWVDFNHKELLDGFKRFTTYFKGFNENRKNMYSADEKSTAISYRLVHENLPKFIDNIHIYNKIKKNFPNLILSILESDLESVIQGKPLDEIFSLPYFNQTLTQTGIEIYNHVIGGISLEAGKTKIKGANELINLHKQKHQIRSSTLPSFKLLYKQILSDRDAISFIPENFEDDSEIFEAINEFYKLQIVAFESDGTTINVLDNLKSLLLSLQNFDLSKIYLRNDTSLTNLSNDMFSDWSFIKKALIYYYEAEINPIGTKKRSLKYDENLDKWLGKQTEQWSFLELQHAIEIYIESNKIQTDVFKFTQITDCISNFRQVSLPNLASHHIFDRIDNAYAAVEEVLNTDYDTTKNLKIDQVTIDQIKVLLDGFIELLHLVKPFIVRDKTKVKDDAFYSLLEGLYQQIDLVTPLYNKVRNYLTQKPYSLKKVKMNFENPNLLSGWPVNQEVSSSSVIFRSEGNYYLGILNKGGKSKVIFSKVENESDEYYEKMFYYQMADPSKDVQNLLVIDGNVVKKNGRKSLDGVNHQLEELKNNHLPSHINSIRRNKSYSTLSPNFNNSDLVSFIDYYKELVKSYYRNFNFIFLESYEYSDFSKFTDHINIQAYQLSFKKVSKTNVHNLINSGNLFLFQIYNKDFSEYSKGKPNMHTLYWKALFDETNLANVIYKLNGEAEIFYREKSLKYSEEILTKGHHVKDLGSKFKYPIIKDKRFAFDKFQFHVPITLNFKAVGTENINNEVNARIKTVPKEDIHIIGIDRGERHLLYLSLINAKGEIIKQKSLNTISNSVKDVDFHTKLQNREDKRDTARKSWQTIENIKELKAGYLSLVVHEIAKLMIEYNAIVILEDLNFGFKTGRIKVEKQVYQKFEKMLIDKLNYLVFKATNKTEAGGLMNALQLTSKFDSFKTIGKQSGFLYYVPAWNTSKIDPSTGFVNFLDTNYSSVENAIKFFSQFNNIHYNAKMDCFEISFDYTKFTTKAEGSQTLWTVYTHGEERYKYNAQHKTSSKVNVSAEIKALFSKNNIRFIHENNLIDDIVAIKDKDFHAKLLSFLSITLTLRQTISGTDVDFILSPVKNKSGHFFDSRMSRSHEPIDSDANGAFHIALKGLWVLEQIHKTDDLNNLKLAISNKEWLQFTQARLK